MDTCFDLYKKSPEYAQLNFGIGMDKFRGFFFQYFHRLWGRLLGVFYIFPLIYFLLKNNSIEI